MWFILILKHFLFRTFGLPESGELRDTTVDILCLNIYVFPTQPQQTNIIWCIFMSQNETNYDAAFVHYVNDCQDKCKMLSYTSQNIVSLAYHNRTQAATKGVYYEESSTQQGFLCVSWFDKT